MRHARAVRAVTTFVLTAAALACSDGSAPTAVQAPGAPRFITNGTPTGDSYGNVGVLFIDEDANGFADFLCSGSLIAPTVFLTAGHCTDFPAGARFYVSFAPDAIPIPAGLIAATAAFHHPDYAFPANDIGVVILPAGSTAGITPLALPPEGYLDQVLARGGLGHQYAVNVGYGVASLGRGALTSGLDGVRKVTETKVLWLHGDFLGLASNAVNAGRGGTCFGDSGGPVFLAGQDPSLVVAVTSYTNNAGCHALGGYVRTDTPSARSFLGQFVTLP